MLVRVFNVHKTCTLAKKEADKAPEPANKGHWDRERKNSTTHISPGPAISSVSHLEDPWFFDFQLRHIPGLHHLPQFPFSR